MNSHRERSSVSLNLDWQNEPDLDRLRELTSQSVSNAAEAANGLEDLAGRGSRMSLFYLGELYRYGSGGRITIGPGIQRDYDRAEYYYQRAVNSGLVHGAYGLAMLRSWQKQYQEAFQALSRGASDGFAPSMHALGWMYRNGQATEANLQKTRELWEAATTLGHHVARTNLAKLLTGGQFGFWQRLRGAWIWLVSLLSIPGDALKDPFGERLL